MDVKGKLYYGDNLEVLRKHIPAESVDLIYLDPPFNSNATYNVLFKSPKTGDDAHSQIQAFDDTWHWGEDDAQAIDEIMRSGHTDIANLIQALRKFLGENDMMAYLVMMAIRLIELHRVLKPTGSLYLHCDPTASHYLKLILDAVFGHENFRNEIVWHYSGWNAKLEGNFNSRHDIVFFYSKVIGQKFNSFTVPWTSVEEYVKVRKQKVLTDETGRKYVLSDGGNGTRVMRYLDEAMQYGKPIDDVWDIDKINNSSKESLGYPTQKPLALLERIVLASSNEGDVILDPFCGCGTTVHAAQKFSRNWIGIDVTHLAICLIEKRMKDAFPDANFEVIGSPKDLESAQDLAIRDKYQFQWWAVSLVGAHPYQDKKKGADSGIDGLIYFMDSEDGEYKKIIVSVKGGDNVGVSMIRDLAGTMEREKAAMGFFVTLSEPTAPMSKEAASKDPYISPLTKELYPRIQILTIKGLMDGTEKPRYPDLGNYKGMFKKAKPERTEKETKLFEVLPIQ